VKPAGEVVVKKAPLSVEELLKKRKEDSEAEKKAQFMTKEQRAELALQRRQQEVEEKKKKTEEERVQREAFLKQVDQTKAPNRDSRYRRRSRSRSRSKSPRRGGGGGGWKSAGGEQKGNLSLRSSGLSSDSLLLKIDPLVAPEALLDEKVARKEHQAIRVHFFLLFLLLSSFTNKLSFLLSCRRDIWANRLWKRRK